MATSHHRSNDQGPDIRWRVVEANIDRARDLRSHFMLDCARHLKGFCLKVLGAVNSRATLRPGFQKQ
ncbi:MAG: hypothetical protein R3D62_11135 [Xanthobacteraceae bacterium]